MTAKPKLGIGLIGSGFMGMTHAFGFATAERVFDLPFELSFECLADATDEMAERARARFGFARATGDWRRLLADPAIDIIDITAPNAFHKEMSLAAIAAGKHVYCEKPLAPLASDALEMMRAADAAGVKTAVGFNYLMNPMLRQARDMIRDGELGEIRTIRCIHAEDYMVDSSEPVTWRHDPVGGGVLADLGSHALATAEYLLGPIAEVLGDLHTPIRQRPGRDGAPTTIQVDDVARAFVRFENGASGTIEANWLATGRKMQHDFEVYGETGGLYLTQERLNELHYYRRADEEGRHGFRTILAGPSQEPYGQFCVAPGHQLGFNDLKAVEIEGFLRAIAGGASETATFATGWRIQHLVETIQASARDCAWKKV
ncbi:MAG: Gfo/Idh/MocA family oxidoreductase [Pseudomonadota bacterium]